MRIILYITTAIIVSLYYFSFGFTFLPPSINSKMILAVVGAGLFTFHTIQNRSMIIESGMFYALLFALTFSIVCLISVDINYTSDYSYATYILSFFTWLGGAYAVCSIIRKVHGNANIRLLSIYLAIVCFTQCVLALLIDNLPRFQQIVDRYIFQGQEFIIEVDRLYGIGASLDNAGVRFAVVLVMVAAVLVNDEVLRKNRLATVLLLVSFFSISIIGNMIARTTTLGVIGGVVIFLLGSGLFRLRIRNVNLYLFFGIILLIAIGISTYLYETNHIIKGYFRYAFEGFFNWIEIGAWRTDSTDKLNRTMWIWPNDLRTWFIGRGLYDNWVFGTDIGYCRFILYCGILGFSFFASFFIYNAVLFARIYRQYSTMFVVFLCLTFTIWIKVSTDIFIIYALFYCLDWPQDNKRLQIK